MEDQSGFYCVCPNDWGGARCDRSVSCSDKPCSHAVSCEDYVSNALSRLSLHVDVHGTRPP